MTRTGLEGVNPSVAAREGRVEKERNPAMVYFQKERLL